MNAQGRVWKIICVGVFITALLVLPLSPSATVQAQSTLPGVAPTSNPLICQMIAPSVGSRDILTGVASSGMSKLTPTALWSVGYTIDMGAPDLYGVGIHTLTMRFTGARWELVPSPNMLGANYLSAVAVRGYSDAWAVGYYNYNYVDKPMLMHFDGVKWAIYQSSTPAPNAPYALSPVNGRLNSVATFGWSQAVAVGYTEGHLYSFRPYVVYYDGAGWYQMPFPEVGSAARLYSVAATSKSNIWATLTYGTDSTATKTSVLYHFDGISWHPQVKMMGSLTGLQFIGKYIWAIGHSDAVNAEYSFATRVDMGTDQELRVKTFNQDIDHNYLTSIATDGVQTYAVGYAGKPYNDTVMTPVIQRFDGYTFVPVATPAPGNFSHLSAATISNGVLWAVGDTAIDKGWTTGLILTTMCNASPVSAVK